MRYTNPYDIGTFFQPQADVTFVKNAIIQWLIIIILIMNIVTVVGLWFFVEPTSSFIKLQYNVYFGTSLFSPWWGPYILPAMSFVFFLIDIFLSYMLYVIKERIFAYSILLGAFLLQITLIVASLSVVLNNY